MKLNERLCSITSVLPVGHNGKEADDVEHQNVTAHLYAEVGRALGVGLAGL